MKSQWMDASHSLAGLTDAWSIVDVATHAPLEPSDVVEVGGRVGLYTRRRSNRSIEGFRVESTCAVELSSSAVEVCRLKSRWSPDVESFAGASVKLYPSDHYVFCLIERSEDVVDGATGLFFDMGAEVNVPITSFPESIIFHESVHDRLEEEHVACMRIRAGAADHARRTLVVVKPSSQPLVVTCKEDGPFERRPGRVHMRWFVFDAYATVPAGHVWLEILAVSPPNILFHSHEDAATGGVVVDSVFEQPLATALEDRTPCCVKRSLVLCFDDDVSMFQCVSKRGSHFSTVLAAGAATRKYMQLWLSSAPARHAVSLRAADVHSAVPCMRMHDMDIFASWRLVHQTPVLLSSSLSWWMSNAIAYDDETGSSTCAILQFANRVSPDPALPHLHPSPVRWFPAARGAPFERMWSLAHAAAVVHVDADARQIQLHLSPACVLGECDIPLIRLESRWSSSIPSCVGLCLACSGSARPFELYVLNNRRPCQCVSSDEERVYAEDGPRAGPCVVEVGIRGEWGRRAPSGAVVIVIRGISPPHTMVSPMRSFRPCPSLPDQPYRVSLPWTVRYLNGFYDELRVTRTMMSIAFGSNLVSPALVVDATRRVDVYRVETARSHRHPDMFYVYISGRYAPGEHIHAVWETHRRVPSVHCLRVLDAAMDGATMGGVVGVRPVEPSRAVWCQQFPVRRNRSYVLDHSSPSHLRVTAAYDDVTHRTCRPVVQQAPGQVMYARPAESAIYLSFATTIQSSLRARMTSMHIGSDHRFPFPFQFRNDMYTLCEARCFVHGHEAALEANATYVNATQTAEYAIPFQCT